MKVVILCGGLGTRLREETEYRPKPMVDIGGRPMLWHIMKIFAQHGLKDFVLCLGYKGNMIKEYFLNYEAMNNDFTISLGHSTSVAYHSAHKEKDFRVTLVDTGDETMTGGRVKRAARFIGDDDFMVTYGDGVSNVDIAKLLEFHKSHGRLATITTVHPISRYGMMGIDDKSRQVTSFVEKPRLSDWINAGYMVLKPQVLDYLEGDDCILEAAPLERLTGEGQLMAYRHEGFFYAMDTFREYKYLNELWASGQAPWKVWE
ncbi:MAG: glucose-1-phosphate cytidylyltransferase [Phycisphaerae bacterium]|jgi:glucose-1-phosphate cytidylyltransferase